MTQPVIILTSPRSFSSVTCAMIGQHPQLYGMPELALYTGDSIGDILKNAPSPAYIQGLARGIAQVIYGSQTIAATFEAYRFMFNNQTMTPHSLLGYLHQNLNGRRIVDKSPAHSFDMSSLERMPKDAHFIHLVRHPATYHESLKNYHHLLGVLPNRESPTCIYDSWVTNQNNIEKFLEQIPSERQMRIQGEDVVVNPIASMFTVASWLGLDTSEESIEAMLHPENSPYACIGNKYAEFGNDAHFLRAPALRPSEVVEASLEGLPADVVEIAGRYGYI